MKGERTDGCRWVRGCWRLREQVDDSTIDIHTDREDGISAVSSDKRLAWMGIPILGAGMTD